MELDSILKLIKNATSDSEKMASLMMVVKLVKSDELSCEERKKIFESIGFTFINRLLATNETPEGCVENPYHKIAVTILACFCTDEDLVIHPQVTAKIPYFNRFIQTKNSESKTMAEDSLQCLRAMSCSGVGVQHLIKYNTMESLAQAYVVQNEVSEDAKDTLLSLLGNSSVKVSECSVSSVIGILAQEFRSNQDELKFKICDTIYSILTAINSSLENSGCEIWLNDVSTGLKDIFSSKIDPQRRESAIHLSSVICQLFGIEWVFQGDLKFLLLWLHLVSMELRLAVEKKELSAMAEKSSLLCSCFIIFENAVVFISKESDQENNSRDTVNRSLDAEVFLQVHAILVEAFTSVVYVLREGKRTSIGTDRLSSEYPIITASVRVLGAWLAEDSLTLTSEVYSLLPFLMELCAASTPQREDEDILKFLLPGCCHMAADDKRRTVLEKTNFPKILASYMKELWLLCEHSSEMRGRLCLCCGVLMNVCVSAPDHVKNESHGTFESITSQMLKIFTNKSNVDDTLVMNAIVLFLMISRIKGLAIQDSELMPAWCSLLYTLLNDLKLCPYINSSDPSLKWNDISELWFIAVQELSRLAPNHEFIKKAASSCLIDQQLSEILGSLIKQEQKEDELFHEIQTSIFTLLQTLK